jgi:gliding motility-associated-like protein
MSTLVFGQKYNRVLPDTMRFCSDDSLAFIELRHDFEKTAIIEWTTPARTITGTKRINVARQSGRYRLKVSFSQGTYKDSTYVRLYTRPKSNIRDTVLCKGQSLVLDAKNAGTRYTWSNHETSQKIKVENSGRYWVKISNRGCSAVDTINVKFIYVAAASFNSDISFCLNDENKILSIKTDPENKITWSNGSTAPAIIATKEGNYWVKTESKTCGVQVDSVRVRLKACECEILIPNSFTPNEDNRNDYFFPVSPCEYSYYNLLISDRWGNTVFSTSNINAKWDGRFKGNLCPEDIYVYRIETVEKGSDKKMVRNGHLSLFR